MTYRRLSVLQLLFNVIIPLCLYSLAFGSSSSLLFEWDHLQSAFYVKGAKAPEIVLYEGNHYVLRKSSVTDSNFSITNLDGTPFVSDNIFNNGISSNKAYIHWVPTIDSPRSLKYVNNLVPDSLGNITIKDKEELRVSSPSDLSPGSMFGYAITSDSHSNLYISATGEGGEGGKIFCYSEITDGFELANFVESPISGRTQLGASLIHYQNSLYVGAPDHNSFSGSVVVYPTSVNGFADSSDYLVIADINGTTGDLFGWDIAITENLLGISAPYSGALDGGSVILYEKSGEFWVQTSSVKSSFPSAGDQFGYALDLSEDFLAVGAPGYDGDHGDNQGAVFLFNKTNGSWVEEIITAPDAATGDRFGHTLLFQEDLLFIGAELGDDKFADSGVVYVYQKNEHGWVFKSKISPHIGGSFQSFSAQIDFRENILGVVATGANEDGQSRLYLFKMGDDPSVWNLISSIQLDFFADEEKTQHSLSLMDGGLVFVGNPNDSTSDGAVRGFLNPSWQALSLPALEPLISPNTPHQLSMFEDELSVSYDFGSIHPFDSNVSWAVSEANASANLYELNATTGKLSYYPPEDFHGLHAFKIQVSNGALSSTHFLKILVNPVQDPPAFSDPHDILPVAEDGTEYGGFNFPIFDPDDEDLSVSLHSHSLPDGMWIENNILVGTPVVNASIDSPYIFEVRLSDGLAHIDKNYTLEVLSKNSPPTIHYRGTVLDNNFSIEMNEDFTPVNWSVVLSDFYVSDVEGNNVSVSLLEPPLWGNLRIEEPLNFYYTPKANFNGTEKFSLRFTDDHPSNPKSTDLSFRIKIKSVNDAPVLISSYPPEVAYEGELLRHEFIFIDADIGDNTRLSFEGLPNWLAFDGLHTITGTPKREDYAPDQSHFIKLIATDQYGAVVSQSFELSVEPLNFPPSIEGDALRFWSMVEDSEDPYTEILRATDPENDELIWAVESSPRSGKLEISPQGSQQEAGISYLPDANFTGRDEFLVVVYNKEDRLARDSVSFTVDVNNTPDSPIFSSVPYPLILRGTPWDYKVRVNDADPDENLSVSVISNLPDWLEFNSSTRLLSGFPPDTGTNLFPVSIKVVDRSGLYDEQNFSINIVNSIELVTINEPQIGDQVIVEDSIWKGGDLSVSGMEGRKLTWSIIEQPENGSFNYVEKSNGAIGEISYTPNSNFFGTDLVTIQVSDGYSSDLRNFTFTITEVADPPIISDYPHAITIEDRDDLNLSISFSDGDGFESIGYEIFEKPAWVNLDVSKFTEGTLLLEGTPGLSNIGEHLIRVKLYGIDDLLENEISVHVTVEVLNYPVVASPSSAVVQMKEDLPSSWIAPGISLFDEETKDASSFQWSVELSPKNGHASIDINGSNFVYTADTNFSGVDEFLLGVTDTNGTNGSPPRTTLVPITVNVEHTNDKPLINSSPITEWTDEFPYSYQLNVVDSDWPWQGYPKIKLTTKLPSWAKWTGGNDGTGILSGSPTFRDEGKHFFSFEVTSGPDLINHSFTINLRVEDYPPVITNATTSEGLDKIRISFDEDNFPVSTWRNLTTLNAYDPDGAQNVNWFISDYPSSGANLKIVSTGSSLQEVNYELPSNFNGTDRFSLRVSEGKDDRYSILPFEIIVKPLPDPPFFNSGNLPDSTLIAFPGEEFKVDFHALDPDKENLFFKIFYSSGDKQDWFGIIEENPLLGKISLGGVPPITLLDDSNFTFTLVATDQTGRFSSTQHTIIYEKVNFPPVIQDGERIEVIFDENISTQSSSLFPMHAIDVNEDSLQWSLSVFHQPRYGDVLLVQKNGILEGLRYVPKDILPARDTFTLLVSDGQSTDSVTVNASFDHTKFLLRIPVEFPPVYEEQSFAFNFFVQGENLSTKGYSASLMQGPSWLSVEKVDPVNFEIKGTAPLHSSGIYSLFFKITHPNGFDSQFVTSKIVVRKKDKTQLKLIGAKELFLPVGQSWSEFEDPGFFATNSNGEDVTDEVVVIHPNTFEYGRNSIIYNYGDRSEERFIWGVEKSPFAGIRNRRSLPASAIIAEGAPPFNDYYLVPESILSLEGQRSRYAGFTIRNWSRSAYNESQSPFYRSNQECFKISDFQYLDTKFYIAGEGTKYGGEVLFIEKVDLDGSHDWTVFFDYEGVMTNVTCTPSASGDLFVCGSFTGSITLGDELYFTDSPSAFGLLIDSHGRYKSSQIYPGVLSNLCAASDSQTENWYFAFDKLADDNQYYAQILVLDNQLETIQSHTLDGIASVQIDTFGDSIFAVGIKLSPGTGVEDEVRLLKIATFGTVEWERTIASSIESKVFLLPGIELNSFGNANLHFSFHSRCVVAGREYLSRGHSDAVLVSISANAGEILWAEQIGGVGDDLIIKQLCNEGGVYSIAMSTSAGLQIGEDQILANEPDETTFFLLRSTLQSPQRLGSLPIEFEVEKSYFEEIHVPNQMLSRGLVLSGEQWVSVVNEKNKIYLSAYPGLNDWLDQEQSNKNLILRILGEQHTFEDFHIPYEMFLPARLESSQSVLPPLNLTQSIKGNARVTGFQSRDGQVILAGNFKGDLVFGNSAHSSKARSNGFIYICDGLNFSLDTSYILSSTESCTIVDTGLDDAGNLFILGNFSGKVKLQNRSLTAVSGNDMFLVKIGLDNFIKEFVAIGGESDQTSTSLCVGGGDIYIGGTYYGDSLMGGKEITSVGKTDGFISRLNPDDLAKIDWVYTIGGGGYDKINDLDWTGENVVACGDFSESVKLNPHEILLNENTGSLFVSLSQEGKLLNYTVLQSGGRLTSKAIKYDARGDSFFIGGEFSEDLISNNSVLSSTHDELFIAKIDSSMSGIKLHKINGTGKKSFADMQISELGYLYLAGNFDNEVKISGHSYSTEGGTDAFVTKIQTSNFSFLDSFLLQSPVVDRVDSIYNPLGNQLLISGLSGSSLLPHSSTRSNTDPYLIRLAPLRNTQFAGEFLELHPVGVSQPFKFEFNTFGWSDGENVFSIKPISVPSWVSVMTDSSGNGFITGFTPEKAGNFPVEFKVVAGDSQEVSLAMKLEILEGWKTPALVVPQKIEIEEYKEISVSFSVENIGNEEIRFSSNFPEWLQIKRESNENLTIHGRPAEKTVGEHKFFLSVSTLNGLKDTAEILVSVLPAKQSSFIQEEQDYNTWQSSWLGPMYILESGWAYHAHLGWLYLDPDPFDGAWIWTKKWDWLWSKQAYWDGTAGNFYSPSLDQWIFIKVDKENKRKVVYNYQSKKWYPF